MPKHEETIGQETFLVRHNPGVKKKMCLEDFVRVTLRILVELQHILSISCRKYGSFSFVLTFVFAFWATRVYRFPNHVKDAQRFSVKIGCCRSQATTVASMEGRRDVNFELFFL